MGKRDRLRANFRHALHDAERQRYERVLAELEHGSATSADFAAGTAMTLEEAVEYALANVD